MVEQQAACAAVWTACTPSLEDSGQAHADVTLGVDRPPLLDRNKGHITRLDKEDRDDLFEFLVDLLNSAGGLSPGKGQTDRRLLLDFRVILVEKIKIKLSLVTSDDVPDLL